MKKHKKLINNIKNHYDDLWIPDYNINYININPNQCYDTLYYKSSASLHFENNLKIQKSKNITQYSYCKKIKVIFNSKQKKLIDTWFNACTIMYNESIDYIKTNMVLDYKILRTYHLKEVRDEIVRKSNIPVHVIDCVIKTACAMYKSALTNYKQGHIKYFRIRKLKHNRPRKVMEIEPAYFNYKNKTSLFYRKIGEVKYIYNGKEIKLEKIQRACNLQYDINRKEYYLFVPFNDDVSPKSTNKVVSIDPGIRTFLTCLSNDEVIHIGTNIQNKIKHYLNKINSIHKIKCKKKIKKKIEDRNIFKIRCLIDDMHWKSIKYLTDNYKTILIGNLSTKEIVNNNKSKITRMTKRIAYAMSFYKFRQRLDYKSKSKSTNCIVVDEAYTSKTCSKCGAIKSNLGSNKVFHCSNCNLKLDRDINGCRNIFMQCH